MFDKGSWRLLAAVSAMALLSGCGWFDSGTPSGKARPGDDQKVAPSSSLPPAPAGGQGEAIAPVDETRNAGQIGSIVPGKGGQKAQKEAAEKEAADRDAKDREARNAREAADKEARAREKAEEQQQLQKKKAGVAPAADTTAGGLPAVPPAITAPTMTTPPAGAPLPPPTAAPAATAAPAEPASAPEPPKG